MADCSKFADLQRQSFCLQSCCAYVAPHKCYQRKTEGIVGCLRRRDGYICAHSKKGAYIVWATDEGLLRVIGAVVCPLAASRVQL